MSPIPGTQSREIREFRKESARAMIDEGLSDREIQTRLRCSLGFVQRLRRVLAADRDEAKVSDEGQ